MSIALVHSRARVGIAAPAVRIEVMLSGGLPHTTMVGLPEAAVRESRDRVRAALLCARFDYPQQRILINLAPADLPKEGGRFDLAIALGILAASDQIDRHLLANYEFLGELALTGELRGVDGALPAAIAAAQQGRTLILAAGNGEEAALAQHADVRVARTLLEVCASLASRSLPHAVPAPVTPLAVADLRDVRGQLQARRALEVAAAGGHHLLLGTPGCGKTLLASRLPGILPDATEAEALETATIASCSGAGIDAARWRHRPYRAPHHTASAVSLVGGGTHPRPGEISLAHNGVLFLDELPEWSRHTLEVLREPLESGTVMVARAARTDQFPSRFQLVAAMNPCPCGWAGDRSGRCRCSGEAIQRYRGRVSGPLLDRIDLHVQVPRLEPRELRSNAPCGEDSATVRARVVAARNVQLERSSKPNAQLLPTELDLHCRLEPDDQHLLESAVEQLQLSARSMHRILRVARTLADLAHSERIATGHLAEAIGYRQVDRGCSG